MDWRNAAIGPDGYVGSQAADIATRTVTGKTVQHPAHALRDLNVEVGTDAPTKRITFSRSGGPIPTAKSSHHCADIEVNCATAHDLIVDRTLQDEIRSHVRHVQSAAAVVVLCRERATQRGGEYHTV